MRAIKPPRSKFRLNRTIWSSVIAEKWFSIWRPSAILNLVISEFLSRFHRLAQYCVCIPDFVKFRRFAAEIWCYNDFQNGGRPPCWIFEIWHFHHQTFVCVQTPNIVLIGQYEATSQVIAKKMIFNMASVGHLEFGNFWNFLTFPSLRSKFASAYHISSYSDDSRLR